MKLPDYPTTARVYLGTLLLLVGVGLLCTIPFASSWAQSPSSGTIHAADTATVKWTATTISPGGVVNDESKCVDHVNCETYTLTVAGTPADWKGRKVQVLLTWSSSTNEYDMYIHKGSNNGPLATPPAISGPGLTSQVAYLDPASTGTGVFTVHVAYDTTPTSAVDPYHGNVSAVPQTPIPPPPAKEDTGPAIGYENFEAPGDLTQVTQSSSGGVTVEYLGRGAGEPSVGSDWKTGVANIQSDLETIFVTFNEKCLSAGPASKWVNRRAPTSQFVDSDPIGFTDRTTGRVFAGELTLLSPDTVKISHTDDDGNTWVPDQSGGIASAVDHETIGGGRYHAPIPSNPVYPNAVYYCSQDIAAALCSRSDDGGLTYGPSVPIYDLTACGGLHGHVKVSPVDGTVFVPNRDCGGEQAVVVSEDNGTTWSVRQVGTAATKAVPSNVGGGDDPAVAVDNGGRLYFGYSHNGTAAAIGVSDDLGKTWKNIVDVGAKFGLKNVAFPAVVTGSKGRAAYAFYGSTTGTGDSNSGAFTGVWHLYVAHTFDGGGTWTTSDLTPYLPMQRGGLLRGGGADITRNLLDFFDITIDRDGRVIVGYVNGCAGGPCSQAAPTAHGNTYSATATLARQSSGRRLLAQKDPPDILNAKSEPGMPFVTEQRLGFVTHLAWNEADTGNSPITSYQIRRGTKPGTETLLDTIPGDQHTYDDSSASDPSKTYYYQVVAVNAAGASCPKNEIAAPYVGDTCSGVVIHKNQPDHPEATGGTVAQPPAPELLIDYIAVGEPGGGDDLMFTMKMEDLATIPPNSRWRIAWNYWTPKAQMFYVGMTSDANSAVTFEYGTLADAGVPAVLVLGETKIGNADPGSHYKADGTITMFVPKSKVGNPKPGDLLAAIGGKTFTGDTPGTSTFERSTALVDHTFIKGDTDNAFPAATYTLAGNGSCSGHLLNISTRLDVHPGAQVSIAGFIVTGTQPKRVLVRGLGPSLSPAVSNVLDDPLLELHDHATILATNDNWKSNQQSAIEATGIAPKKDAEAAILRTLAPGSYTAVLKGASNSSGVGLVEVYDLDLLADSEFANISTRGSIETGNDVMIGGFILGGGRGIGAADVVVRALGPSLDQQNVPGAIRDPMLELHDSNGATIAANDNWQKDPGAAKIQAHHLAPTDPKEAATFQTLAPGAYTAVVRGKDNTTGIGLVEVYDLP